MKKNDIGLLLFLSSFHVFHIDGKEIEVEKNGYFNQKFRVQGVFIQDFVDIVPAAR
jgi:hypothetical protein